MFVLHSLAQVPLMFSSLPNKSSSQVRSDSFLVLVILLCVEATSGSPR